MRQLQHLEQTGLNRSCGGRCRAAASLHMTMTTPHAEPLIYSTTTPRVTIVPKAMAAACMLSTLLTSSGEGGPWG